MEEKLTPKMEELSLDAVLSPPLEQQSNGHPPPPPPGISASPSPAPQDSGANGAPLQQFAHAESSRAASYPRKEQGVLESLMQSFHSAKEMAERRVNDPSELSNALDVSYQNAPAQQDAEP